MNKPHTIGWADVIGYELNTVLASDSSAMKSLRLEMAILGANNVRIHYRVAHCGLTLYEGSDLGQALEYYNHAQ